MLSFVTLVVIVGLAAGMGMRGVSMGAWGNWLSNDPILGGRHGSRFRQFRGTTLLWLGCVALLLAVNWGAIVPSSAQTLSAPSEMSLEAAPVNELTIPAGSPPDADPSEALATDSSEEEATEDKTTQPAITDEVFESAPVMLNRVPLFPVSGSGQFTAEERASTIGQRLQTFIDELGQAGVEPELEIAQLQGSPTLMLNGKQLLTVTPADAYPTKQTPEALAKLWSDDLQVQLQLAIEEQSPDYWRDRAVTALGIFGLTLLLHIAIVIGMKRGREWLGQNLASYDPDADPPKLLNMAFRGGISLVLIMLWLSSLSYAAELFPLTRRLSYGLREQTLKTLTAPIIPLGEGYSVVQLVLLAVLFVALVIAASALTDLLKSRLLSVLGIGRGVQEAIATVFKYSFVALSSMVLLQLWGIDLSSLAIFASALSVGIGFGLQDIAKNFGSGLVLVFERPIQVGDFVEVGGYSGTIEKLGARSTTIRTLDNLDVFVPNSRFLEEEVTNWSHARSPSRIKIPVGVAYGTDLELVQEGLLEAALASKNVLKTPEPAVLFEGFGDSSLDFVLMVWIARPQQHARIKSELNFKIDAAFRRRKIEIPFPQRDLHVRSSDLPVQLEGGMVQVTAPEDGALDVE